jgi:hypothetical protein
MLQSKNQLNMEFKSAIWSALPKFSLDHVRLGIYYHLETWNHNHPSEPTSRDHQQTIDSKRPVYGSTALMLLRIFRWTLWNLRKAFLIENGVVLL